MLASEGYNKSKVEELVRNELMKDKEGLENFTWHDCSVCNSGLTTHVIEDENLVLEKFQLAWQSSVEH